MEFVQLTSAQRESFDTDGYLVVPSALDRATVKQLTAEADALAAPFLNKPELSDKPEYNHLDHRRGLLKQKALLALVTSSTTVPLVVQLLSTNIHLHSTTIIYKRPETPDGPSFRRGWHRAIGPGFPRCRSHPLFDCRSGGPLSCAASGHALELFDLPRELT